MRRRSFIMIAGIIFLVAAAGFAQAQQNNAQGAPSTPPMSLAPTSANQGGANASAQSIDAIVSRLNLATFEVASGDISSCTDEPCQMQVRFFNSVRCVLNSCSGSGQNVGLGTCFGKYFEKYSIQEKEQVSSDLCAMIKSPGSESRRVLLGHFNDLSEKLLVNIQAFTQAINGSAPACEQVIKEYMGAYGPQWSYIGYRDLAGCRITAHQRTRKQEEQDFATWIAVGRGLAKCSDISNVDMRDACNTPGAASPEPPRYTTYGG